MSPPISVPNFTGSICFDPSNSDISFPGIPFQVASSADVAPDKIGKVSPDNEAFMGRSLAPCYKSQDTSTVSKLNPKAGLLLLKVERWKPFGHMLLFLLNWSSLIYPIVKEDFYCSPCDEALIFAGVRKAVISSDTTVPDSPSGITAPNDKELASPAVNALVVKTKLHICSSTDTCKVSALRPKSLKSGLHLRELKSLSPIWQRLLISLYKSFALQRREVNLSLDTEESSLLLQLSTFLQINAVMSSQSSQCVRYPLTLFTGIKLLPVISWYFQTQFHVERPYL